MKYPTAVASSFKLVPSGPRPTSAGQRVRAKRRRGLLSRHYTSWLKSCERVGIIIAARTNEYTEPKSHYSVAIISNYTAAPNADASFCCWCIVISLVMCLDDLTVLLIYTRLVVVVVVVTEFELLFTNSCRL